MIISSSSSRRISIVVIVIVIFVVFVIIIIIVIITIFKCHFIGRRASALFLVEAKRCKERFGKVSQETVLTKPSHYFQEILKIFCMLLASYILCDKC